MNNRRTIIFLYNVALVLSAVVFLLFAGAVQANNSRPAWVDLLSYEEGGYMYFVGSADIYKDLCHVSCVTIRAKKNLTLDLKRFLGERRAYPFLPPMRFIRRYAEGNTVHVLARVKISDIEYFWEKHN